MEKVSRLYTTRCSVFSRAIFLDVLIYKYQRIGARCKNTYTVTYQHAMESTTVSKALLYTSIIGPPVLGGKSNLPSSLHKSNGPRLRHIRLSIAHPLVSRAPKRRSSSPSMANNVSNRRKDSTTIRPVIRSTTSLPSIRSTDIQTEMVICWFGRTGYAECAIHTVAINADE